MTCLASLFSFKTSEVFYQRKLCVEIQKLNGKEYYVPFSFSISLRTRARILPTPLLAYRYEGLCVMDVLLCSKIYIGSGMAVSGGRF
jgi:hypothetical protein